MQAMCAILFFFTLRAIWNEGFSVNGQLVVKFESIWS